MACTLVIGGARSGKSSYAERFAQKLEKEEQKSVIFIATAEVTDKEMENRIKRHKNERPQHWLTIEEPLNPHEIIPGFTENQIVILDCLSLLLNNWIFIDDCSEEQFFERAHALSSAIERTEAQVIMVTNEVGQGIVPADEITRKYRDWLGWLNQEIARVSSSVILVVAGIPVDLRKVCLDQ